MIELTKAQEKTIQKMHGYQAVAQFATGEVLVAFTRKYQNAMIIGNDGYAWSFKHFLTGLEQPA